MKNYEIILDKKIYYPGEHVRGTFILRIDKSMKIRKIKLEIIGFERAYIGVSHGWIGLPTTHSHIVYQDINYIINIRDFLVKDCEFKPGDHNFPISFKIPKNALPSYFGRNTDVEYLIKVQIDVPLWFNKKTQKTFRVLYNPKIIQQMAEQISFTSKHFNITPLHSSKSKLDLFDGNKQKPGFFVELDKDTYLAGDNITGKITINNPTQKKIRKINVILRAKEYASADRYTRYVTIKKYKNRIDVDNIVEGVPSKFSIPIPRRAKTSFYGVYSRCEWFLEFNMDIALAFNEKLKREIVIYQW